MPELLAEIADVAGLPAALAIAQLKGGTRTHFPFSADDDHWLPVLVGREAADKLCAHFAVGSRGGVSVQVPLGPKGLYRVAETRAHELRAEGHSLSQIALTLGVSSRAVEKWLAKARHEEEKRAARKALIQGDRFERQRSGKAVQEGAGVRFRGVPPRMREHKGRRATFLPFGSKNEDQLAPMLAELVPSIGEAAVLAIAESKGGDEIEVAALPSDHAWLHEILSEENLGKFLVYIAQKYSEFPFVEIPVASSYLMTAIRQKVSWLYEEGQAYSDISSLLGITRSIVYEWCSIERNKAAQLHGLLKWQAAAKQFKSERNS